MSDLKAVPIRGCVDVDLVLEKAKDTYESVLIIGYDKEGNLDVRSDASINGKEALWLIESFKTKLLNGEYAE